MKQVRVYYAGIPVRNNKEEKKLVLQYFHQGVTLQGQSKEITQATWEPADLAVLQGWVHKDSGRTPHLNFRRHVIESQKKIGKHTLIIDSNLFLYADMSNSKHYLRFSLNDVFPSTGVYFTRVIDKNRWLKISNDLNIKLKPWRKSGNHILICLQRNGGWSMKGVDVCEWCNKVIKRLRKLTDRPILIRKHPGDKKIKINQIKGVNVRFSSAPNIKFDLENAWATITFNSSPGVASAIEGIPVFVLDPLNQDSQAFDIANFDLHKIDNPNLPDRQNWIEKISMCHFNFDDLKNGVAWNIIKEYI